MPEQQHTTEKEPYIGSVRFFKNLLLLLVIVLIAIPTVAAVCLYRSGRDTKEQLRLLQEGDTAQARYSTEEMSAEAGPETSADEVDDPLSYQQLYPDFYAEEPAPAQVTRENTMYLTFDDGPSPQTTAALLDGLKERGAHATFFLIGEQIAGNEDLVRRMKDEGHQVGGHSYTHIRLDSADVAALAEIQKTDETLRAILGDGDYWLRPPWGFASDALKSAVSVPLIYWTIDTMDWSVRNRDLVAHHIIENAKSGDIVLLHDPYDTSVEAALQTIDVLSEQGYEFVTLEELFSNAGVTPQAGHFYLRADEEVPW